MLVNYADLSLNATANGFQEFEEFSIPLTSLLFILIQNSQVINNQEKMDMEFNHGMNLVGLEFR